LRVFLRFVVEKTLAGQQDAIKEYTIAVEVCGRGTGFDARVDPIVRVDANRLRSRLDAYYRVEGRQDPIRIEMQKGSYVPTIRPIAPSPPRSRGASLAVLPFVNLGPQRDDDSFADGLTEELIHQLSRIAGLRVIARTSAFQYRSKGGDVRRIAAELGVAYVVEGSVRSAGDQIRVTVQLTEIDGGTVQWSDRYERRLRDVFAVQDDICRSIASALKVELAGPVGAAQPRPEARAHVEYLKGRFQWNRRTIGSLAQSLEHYRRAIQIDPQYAQPHCGISDTLLVQALDEQAAVSEVIADARAHADRAMRLAPDLAEALASSAAVASILEWDWTRGEALFQRAIEVNPNFSLGHYLYAITNLAPRARWEDALIAMDRALELDPVSPVLYRDLGVVHYLRGEYGEAAAALRSAATLDPSFRGSLFWLGRTLAEEGQVDEALEMFEARRSAPGANTRVLAAIVHTLALMGRRAEALERLAALERAAAAGGVPPLNMAIAQLGLGRFDEALENLELAYRQREVPLYQVAVDPIYRPVHHSPRFQAIVREMGLGIAGSA
jgi:serine/threonine-protein kinase